MSDGELGRVIEAYVGRVTGFRMPCVRLSEAEPLYRRALDIFETSLGTEPRTVNCRRNLEALLAAIAPESQ